MWGLGGLGFRDIYLKPYRVFKGVGFRALPALGRLAWLRHRATAAAARPTTPQPPLQRPKSDPAPSVGRLAAGGPPQPGMAWLDQLDEDVAAASLASRV